MYDGDIGRRARVVQMYWTAFTSARPDLVAPFQTGPSGYIVLSPSHYVCSPPGPGAGSPHRVNDSLRPNQTRWGGYRTRNSARTSRKFHRQRPFICTRVAKMEGVQNNQRLE